MFLLFAGLAGAATIVGNPNVIIETDSNTTITLWALALTDCSANTLTFPLRKDIAANSSIDVTFPAGEYCDIEAVLHGPPSAVTLNIPSADVLDIQAGATDDVVLMLSESNNVIMLSSH